MKKYKILMIVIIFIIVGFIFNTNIFATNLPGNDLVIKVKNVKPGKGNIVAFLYNSDTKYLNDPYKKEIVNISDFNNVSVKFKNITPGVYSVMVFQDENSNEKLDSNFLGFTIEEYGFSKNIKSTIGMPDWENTMFEFDDKELTLEIKID